MTGEVDRDTEKNTDPCPPHTKLVDEKGNAIDETSVRLEFTDKDAEAEVTIKNNYINAFLLNTKYGLAVNILALVVVAIVAFSAPHPFDAVYNAIFKPKLVCTVLGVVALMHAVVIVFVYGCSRWSSSTGYSWFIGTLGAASITSLALFDVQAIYLTSLSRLVLGEELTRLTMKIAAFLIECNKSEQVFKETNIWSFLYFLIAPTLQYKVKYPRVTKNVRWYLILINVSWFVTLLTLYFRIFDDYMYPLCLIDIPTASVGKLVVTTLYIVSFSLLTYYVMVTFFFFSILNETIAELLHFSDRCFFGGPSDLLKGTKLVRAINIVVSDFLYHYIYKPFYSMSQSRYVALYMVFFLSMVYHEIAESYALTQLILPNLLVPFISPLVLLKRTTNMCFHITRLILVAIALAFYMYIHVIEYIAWRSPSVDTSSESKLRLVPLSFSLLAQKFFNIQ